MAIHSGTVNHRCPLGDRAGLSGGGQPRILGLSPITCTEIVPAALTPENPPPTSRNRVPARKQMPPPPARTQLEQPTPTLSDSSPARKKRKRKGKKPLPGEPYAIKRQLSDEVAQKIASTPSVETHTPTQNPNPFSGTTQKPDTPPRPPKTASPTTPAANTNPSGIVVHGVALRKDLSKVRKWLEADIKVLGKTVGIRWLKKKTMLVDEGKKTRSVVVYLENTFEGGRVRLGGRWLRTDQYERDRGRK
ncbi:hypothetical protein BDZ91DRAFT_797815 [Kalaharituber pfeilii]|nr:hypothetical protein BDZ91DRAFT_797815 [Kalaharituber pfeilii]